MVSSQPNLLALPAEVLLNILWHSRELSLINVSRLTHAALPAFSPLARSVAVLAFSKTNTLCPSPGGENYKGPVTEWFLQEFHSILPKDANLSFPLSPDKRAQLQHDVLCSGWWNINRFYGVHLFLFQYHLLNLEARVDESKFWMEVAQSHYFARYTRNVAQHWKQWTAPLGSSQSSKLPSILPWKSMPNQTFWMGSPLEEPVRHPPIFGDMISEEETTLTLNQHAFMFERNSFGLECWNILRVNVAGWCSDNDGGDEIHTAHEEQENRQDRKSRLSSLPPRPLLTPPFTPRKRGILVYLVQEAAGRCFITDTPLLNNNASRHDDRKLLHRAIIEAIPLGDVQFIKVLLALLQEQTPPHLAPDQGYSQALAATVDGSEDRSMVHLLEEKASWSQEDMDKYVFIAMSSGNLHVLNVLLDVYATYDKRTEDVIRFGERMHRLIDKYDSSIDDLSIVNNPTTRDAVRKAIKKKVRSMKINVRTADYTKDKWLDE